MLKVWNGYHWKPARSQPEQIRRGKKKGKYRVMIFTANPEHPEGLSQIIVNQDDLKETEDTTPPAVQEMQSKAKHAVKFGNGLKQSILFKGTGEQRSLF